MAVWYGLPLCIWVCGGDSVSERGLFLQNVIAIVWDFDKTLSPAYMQSPLFEAYGVDEARFWDEVRALPEYYLKAGVKLQEDTCYLGHLLSYVRHGRMPGLSNAKLREVGGGIPLYEGLPEFFERLQMLMEAKAFRDGDLRLEHYIVSTGLEEMVRGSKVAAYVDDVWASVFIEEPAAPGFDPNVAPQGGEISQIAGFLDNTTKTRALFEINKGVNVNPDISVNDTIPEEERRVPFRNMIYVADGPSDIPSFSVVKEHGGATFAVYDPHSDGHYDRAASLHESKRVDMFGPASYLEGSETDKWLRRQVRRIAEGIMKDRKEKTASTVTPGPQHI
jgi:hypothetical protein